MTCVEEEECMRPAVGNRCACDQRWGTGVHVTSGEEQVASDQRWGTGVHVTSCS